MKEQTNPFFDLANIIDVGQYKEKPVRTLQPGDTDIIQPIKRNPLYGIPADLLQAAHNLTIRNPDQMTGAEVLSQLAGIPSIAKTLDRLSGGFQLHSGSWQTAQMLPETRDALLALAPIVAKPAVQGAKAVGRGALAAAKSDAAYDLANRVAKLTGAAPMQMAPSDLARTIANTPVSKLGRAGITSKSGEALTETFTPEELELIQNSIVMSRRKTLDDLYGADKRLKSVHETNRTGAASGPLKSKQARAESEPEMFGGTGQAYGYLTLDPLATMSGELSPRFPAKGASHIAPTSQIPEYGRFGLVMHPELRGRTTFTIDDSLDRTLGSKAYAKEILNSMPYENSVEPGSVLHGLATDYDAMLRDIVGRLQAQGVPQWQMQDKLAEELARMNKPVTFAELLRSEGLPPIGDGNGYVRIPRQIPRMLDNPTEPSLLSSEIYQLGGDDTTHFRNKLLQRDPMGYVEAQVHGDVTPEHIQRIYDFGYEPSLKAEKQAKKLGIEYVPRPEAAYDIIKRENPQTMGEFYRLAEELGVLPSYLKGRESDSPMLPFGGNYAKGGRVSTNPFDHLV